MKILADLQACQSLPHRSRGIGRYSSSLASAIQQLRGQHELQVALNAAIPGTIEPLRGALSEDIRIAPWTGLADTAARMPGNANRRTAAGVLRAAAFAARGAAIHHVSSFFEGYIDDVVVDIPVARTTPVAVTLYDLIPLLYPDLYLQDEANRRWYLDRVDSLRRADLLLAISECTRRDAIEHLGIDPERVVNISAAVDARFRPQRMSAAAEAALRRRLGIDGRFLFYTGGIDHRKNIGRLIEAFAKVDPDSRRDVQLAIACSVEADTAHHLRAQAAAAGLAPSGLVLPGYVSDDDLVELYNLCDAFVFPSWYEGFGLPVLEAMRCGAAVIAADRASVPEIVGRSDALFDPFSVDDIARRISSVLVDADFRRDLRDSGLVQSRRFSWSESAERAVAAMHETVRRTAERSAAVVLRSDPKPTLAFVSPLPPERTGIADYSGELVPELAKHYRVVLITEQARIDRQESWPDLEVRDVAWFEQHAERFDRILYQVGNSAFHAYMPTLIERFGGVVVLHDFFLSGVVSHLQWASKIPGFWHEYLYRSHGYRALGDLASGIDPEEMLLRYPCNLPIIENADGIIVHSEHARDMGVAFYGDLARNWSVVPFLKLLPHHIERATAREQLGIAADEFVVCSFGILGEAKLNQRLLDAWQASSLQGDPKCRLVFVGGAHDPVYEAALRDQIASSPDPDRIAITGYVSSAGYRRYLQAADAAVQLRQNSRGETSASVFDCLAFGIPTVINAHGSMAELPEDAALCLPDVFAGDSLQQALEALRTDRPRAAALSQAGVDFCRSNAPPAVADRYRDAIERAYATSGLEQVRKSAVALAGTWSLLEERDRCLVAEALASNVRTSVGPRQLLVDVTELARRDAKSGIQRVVRSIVRSLLKSPPAGYRVEPVYAVSDEGYRYARKFCHALLGLDFAAAPDEPVAVGEGDVFIGLDLALDEIPHHAARLQHMRDLGARVHVVVYDLLPLVRNQYFPPHAEAMFRNWLRSLATVADGALCISRAVADELVTQLDALDVDRSRPFQVGYFHLGADIQESLPTRGIARHEQLMIDSLAGRVSFLMVGTIEPRKGHSQSLDAFELLWNEGEEQRLVVIGKPGWMTEPLVERMRSHPELGKRLLWFDSATDEVLDTLYGACSALLAASEGEGFGLPLIEAARHGLPILARDLPVFVEVAGDGAIYFSGHEAADLATAIQQWCDRNSTGDVPPSTTIPWITWQQSADMLVDAAIGESHYATWLPGTRRYLPVHDSRNVVPPGHRMRGSAILPTRAGPVISLHPIALGAGRYRLLIFGAARGEGMLHVDIAGQTQSVSILADVNPGSARTALGQCRFDLDEDMPALAIVVRSDGNVAGELSALLVEVEEEGAGDVEGAVKRGAGSESAGSPVYHDQ